MSIPSTIGGDTGLQFVVGQDETGRWIALESSGRGGGIFVNRQAALNYAAFEAGRRPGAVRCSTEPLALWHANAAGGRGALT
jgi:hypothetical protein